MNYPSTRARMIFFIRKQINTFAFSSLSPNRSRMCNISSWRTGTRLPGGRFKNHYELLNLRALKISPLYQNHSFQCMGKIFCVEFQRYPLKFHTKYLTHTLKDVEFIHRWKFKSAWIFELISVFETPPPPLLRSQSQHYGCWNPVNTGDRDISNLNICIDIDLPEWSCCSIRWVNIYLPSNL